MLLRRICTAGRDVKIVLILVFVDEMKLTGKRCSWLLKIDMIEKRDVVVIRRSMVLSSYMDCWNMAHVCEQGIMESGILLNWSTRLDCVQFQMILWGIRCKPTGIYERILGLDTAVYVQR